MENWILSPCNGIIVELNQSESYCEVGDIIGKAESMKMFFDIVAPQSGCIQWQCDLAQGVSEGDFLGTIQ